MVAAEIDRRSSLYSLLITDDNDSFREGLGEAFAEAGYDTRLARCGRDAVRIVRHHYIHVAILDMHMPDLTGLETLRLIRQEADEAVPCILMTAHPTLELRRQALDANAYSFVEKPFSLGLMRDVVSDLIEAHYHDV